MAGCRVVGQPAQRRYHPHLECFDRENLPPPPWAQGSRHSHRLASRRKSPGHRTRERRCHRLGHHVRDRAKTLNRGKAPIPALCYSPGGDSLAAAVGDVVCVWDPATGELRKSLAGHARAVRRIKWNASGKLLATNALFDSVEDLGSGERHTGQSDRAWGELGRGCLVAGLCLACRWENVLPGNRREPGCRLSIWRIRRNGPRCAKTTRPARMIWNSARTDFTWLRLVPGRSTSGTGGRAESRSLHHPERSEVGSPIPLGCSWPGPKRQAALRCSTYSERRPAGVFDGNLAEIYCAATGATRTPVCFRWGGSHLAVVDAGRLPRTGPPARNASRCKTVAGRAEPRLPGYRRVFLGSRRRFSFSMSRAASACEFCRSPVPTGPFNHWRGAPMVPFLASSSLLPGDRRARAG